MRRIDERVLQITLPQFAMYQIIAPETLTVEVPAAAVLSQRSPTLTTPLVIAAKDRCVAALK